MSYIKNSIFGYAAIEKCLPGTKITESKNQKNQTSLEMLILYNNILIIMPPFLTFPAPTPIPTLKCVMFT